MEVSFMQNNSVFWGSYKLFIIYILNRDLTVLLFCITSYYNHYWWKTGDNDGYKNNNNR